MWSVSGCGSCTHQFINPQPSWDDLKFYYDNGYRAYSPNHGTESGDEDAIHTAQHTGKLRGIPLPSGKRLLDAGCGAGSFLRIANKLGALGEGIEPSEYASGVARSQGLKVFCGTIEAFAEQTTDTLDIITSHHVIEHVPDPVASFRAMRKLLAPNGFIWIAVPNAAYPPAKAIKGRWHSSDLPYHLMQFSPTSLRTAGEIANLKVRTQKTLSIPHLVETSLAQYFRYKWMIPRKISHGSGILKPLAGWYAKRMDRRHEGEAIITEFVA
jgi:2-polyprenyl-3-methyl-5-hydroxy-6-metoxy-1,4-benzoquinol methylase